MKRIYNYCGFGKSLFWRAPYWALHNASCEIHDKNYTIGGNKEDRLMADVGFLKHMMIDISDQSDYKSKKKAAFSACIYYLLVRVFGRFSFNYK